VPVLQAAGREENGYTWEGIARLLIAEHLPHAADQLEHDSESGMLAVYSSNRGVLEALGILMREEHEMLRPLRRLYNAVGD
jgi:hypothetical protein